LVIALATPTSAVANDHEVAVGIVVGGAAAMPLCPAGAELVSVSPMTLSARGVLKRGLAQAIWATDSTVTCAMRARCVSETPVLSDPQLAGCGQFWTELIQPWVAEDRIVYWQYANYPLFENDPFTLNVLCNADAYLESVGWQEAVTDCATHLIGAADYSVLMCC
jgi:hypothetical protein